MFHGSSSVSVVVAGLYRHKGLPVVLLNINTIIGLFPQECYLQIHNISSRRTCYQELIGLGEITVRIIVLKVFFGIDTCRQSFCDALSVYNSTRRMRILHFPMNQEDHTAGTLLPAQ